MIIRNKKIARNITMMKTGKRILGVEKQDWVEMEKFVKNSV